MAEARKGMSEREYGEHSGKSRWAVQEWKRRGHLVLFDDGSIDPEASDRRRAELATSGAGAAGASPKLIELREQHEAEKVRRARINNARLEGSLIDRAKAEALVFQLARQEREAWASWPARVAALIASEVGADPAKMEATLRRHVRRHLEELADVKFQP